MSEVVEEVVEAVEERTVACGDIVSNRQIGRFSGMARFCDPECLLKSQGRYETKTEGSKLG